MEYHFDQPTDDAYCQIWPYLWGFCRFFRRLELHERLNYLQPIDSDQACYETAALIKELPTDAATRPAHAIQEVFGGRCDQMESRSLQAGPCMEHRFLKQIQSPS